MAAQPLMRGLAAGMIACVQQLGAAAGLAVLTTLAFRRASSAISAGIPDQAAAVAGYQLLAFQVAGLGPAAGAALVLLMTDHTRRRQVPQRSLPAQA